MFKILVSCATSKELQVVKSQIKKLSLPLKVDFLQTWMWNYSTIFSLTQKLSLNNYDFVLNIWVCGARWNAKPGLYQISNIFDFEAFKELIVPDFVEISYPATCISANKPLKTSDLKKFFDKLPVDFLLMDMESFGFESVMQKFNLPRLILKVPVDFTDEQLEKFSFEKALNLLASIEYEKIFTKVSDFLNKLPSNEENFYGLPFTVSEKEIFNFLSKKYKFVYGDFDKFIKEFLVANESLNKKQQAKLLIKILKEKLWKFDKK